MMGLREILDITEGVEYKDWMFVVEFRDSHIYLQIQFLDHDTKEVQKCRKWLLSQHMTETEIVNTCYLAVRNAEEHEMNEKFTYGGHRVCNPHAAITQRAAIAAINDVRTPL